MKKFLLTSILALLVAAGAIARPQEYPDEYLGLPGDNLNLYAVMKLFQESETLEGFERNLNDQNSRINNLDLNADNLIDYISVQDYVDGDVHTIVLRVALNRKESQDVAVFTVQKFRDGSAQIQLVGDEALYGSNYIIEPIYDETSNPGYTGRPANRSYVTVVRTTPYEIAAWPLVRYIFLPNYVIWRSSWYWGYYPSYWNPWQPYYWHYYYGYHYNWYHHYYNHYRHWDHPRYMGYNDFYYRNVRAHSPYVSERIREGRYRDTYSRPEQRNQGVALYTRENPNRARRTADNTPAIQERRSVTTQTGRERTSAGSSSANTRRSTATDSQNPASRSASDQNAGTARRSTSTVSDKPATKSSSEKSTGTSRRSSSTVRETPASRSDAGQRTQTTRTTRKSTSGTGTSVSRSRNTEPAVRKSTDRTESKSSSSSRRK